jgi:hypothetical protein
MNKMFDLAKEIVETNIHVWGEGFLTNALIVSFAIGTVVTFFLMRKK